MERLAWVEVVNRHGDVLARHPVHAWPFRIGRAYDNDLVLDDPYVAPRHLEATLGDDGSFHLRVMDGSNPLTVGRKRAPLTSAAVSGDEVARIGQTQLRLRPTDYAVPVEKRLRGRPVARRWPALLGSALLLSLVTLANSWLGYTSPDGFTLLVSPILTNLTVLLVWCGFWALICRVAAGRANFVAHFVYAALALTLFEFLDGIVYPYADFAFDTDLAGSALTGITGMLLFATLLYKHLGLAMRMGRMKLGFIVSACVAAVFGLTLLQSHWGDSDEIKEMAFSGTVAPRALLLTREKSVKEFMANAEALKADVDAQNAAH